ncbi:MAG: GspE/PulE family protein [Phycisphaerae bacterium]
MALPPETNVVELVDGLIHRALGARATDVHFEPTDAGFRVRMRVDALLEDIAQIPAPLAPNVVARLKVLAGLLTYRTDTPQEGAIPSHPDGYASDIRVATFPTIRGERVVLRLLADAARLLRLPELGFEPPLVERLRALVAPGGGLVVVCGPAGSGKTTTLHALLLEILAARPHASVFAVEDPVEIRIDGVTQVQIEPARGLTYPVALRSLLRQDPQVLMIGEVRDAEVAQVVVEAALTGHLVLTTLHSGAPADALIRLCEMRIPPYQLTSALRGVLAQRLLRRRCGACREAAARAGCRDCRGTGYSGQVAIGSLCERSPALRAAILANADADGLAAAGAADRLHASAVRLVQEARTDEAEVMRVLGAET